MKFGIEEGLPEAAVIIGVDAALHMRHYLGNSGNPLRINLAVVGREQDGVREFLGIPFAAPPVGALRWRAPQSVAPWSIPRDATRRARACTQLKRGGVGAESGEDCLTLNVWTPVGAGQRLPVLVWIHGGAFVNGSGADPLYDGALLAARAHAVVVTVNYRLGPLGFMSHRQLADEAGRAVSPSLGILDQRAALQWVRRNVVAFGGDPDSVTLFGQSAGAFSVCTHLASPGSRGLFARAIMESGACADMLYFDGETAAAQGVIDH